MRVLITGGAGFLGQHVSQRLFAAGDSVVLYDLMGPPRGEPTSDRVSVVRGDVTDGLHLLRTAKERAVDTIVHLAALLAVESDADPGLAVRVACGGMINALETARVLGLRRVLWASSAAVFGGILDGRLIANDSPFAPLNVYGATKVLNERLAARYSEAFGVDSIGFRFSVMIGLGKQSGISGRIGSELVEKPARGEPGRVPYGDDTASWLWADDAAEAVALGVHFEGREHAKVYNTGGETRTLHDAAEIIRTLVPGARLTLEPGTANLFHDMDVSVIEKELGFRPRTPLEQQLRLLVERARAGASAAD